MNKINLKKEYVDVIEKHNTEGKTLPLAISINNHLYEIDKIKYCCRAASLKYGGTGIRYTVKAAGHLFFLYNEDNGKWCIDKNI